MALPAVITSPRRGLPEAAAPELRDGPPGHLAGVYACYSPAWSPYFEGRIIRGTLAIEAAAGGAPALVASYTENVALGRVEMRGQVTLAGRSVCVDLLGPPHCRLVMTLFLPGMLASVLAGVVSGASLVDADSQPAASRIVMVRIPRTRAAALEATNRYLDTLEPLSRELAALGLPATAPAELDALLDGFLATSGPGGYIKVGADEYSRLALAIDRLFIENGLVGGVQPFRARPRRATRDRVRLVQG